MCSIAGFFNVNKAYTQYKDFYMPILEEMNHRLKHRGPDDEGIILTDNCGMAHTRLSIRDLVTGSQPMTRDIAGHKYHIIYNGEIYNASELKNELIHKGYDFLTTSDTEVLLLSFIHYGADFIANINGIFAFSIYDEYHNVLYLYRDHFGVKPLYYSLLEDNTIVYGSELKAIFAYPDIQPVVDRSGLCEIFALGPSKTPGNGVYKGISEVKPGHYIKYDKYGLSDTTYFRLISHPHEDSYEETVEKTSFLVQDAITRQIVSDVPICTFLSGGIDSSIVSSVCATHLRKQGQQLHTYSFDFTDNDKYFKSNSFQPEQDRPYVDIMCDYIHSNHTYLTCDKEMLADMLYDSVLSRDLPTMADVDSSLLYFCGLVAQENKVVLTGECADEVFGGYPWFYKSELLECDTFPWMKDLSPRQMLLKKEFVEYLNMEDYVAELYNKIISEINVLPGDNDVEVSRRRIGYMNIRMFMQTLLDRMDRTSMYNGLEARVPFADYRLVQYMFNVPWEYKYRDNTEKSLLRHAAAGIVPQDVLYRKKSPYPKTYNPYYETLLAKRLREVIEDYSSPINEFLDKTVVQQFLSSPKDYGKPWYGQLMAGPQMIAYLLQINYWLKEYNVAVEE